MITGDFETRSEADIFSTGAWAYSIHPSTRVHCLAWSFDDDPETYLWHRAYPDAYRKEKSKKVMDPLHEGCSDPLAFEELMDRVRAGDLFEAHNAFFERCIWSHVLVPQHEWPEVDPAQWRCTAAKAAAFALPRALEKAAKSLRLGIQKDMEGHRLMLKMAKPRSPLKSELVAAGIVEAKQKLTGQEKDAAGKEFYRKHGALWHEDRAELQDLFKYCRQDVATERAVSSQLRELPPVELETWKMDQAINARGIYVDRQGVVKAMALARERAQKANQEVAQITGGKVARCSMRADFLEWLQDKGLAITNTQADTIRGFLKQGGLSEPVARAMSLWAEVNRTSTKKYSAMMDRVGPDDRVRDILMYCGAERTGRWAGRGIQPQNFPRGQIKDMELTWKDIYQFDLASLTMLYGDPMNMLAGALRGALCAPAGRDLVVADYSAIEARVLFWLAKAAAGLSAFREIDAGLRPGEDIYTVQASEILGRKVTKADKNDRQVFGKVPVLGCGYQMSARAMVTYAEKMGVDVTPERAKELVDGYRNTFPEVKSLWSAMEEAALDAVRRGPRSKALVDCSYTSWAVRGRFLHCKLPSGRLLSYFDPQITPTTTPWNAVKDSLTYMGVHTKTHQWCRTNTYGGKLVENTVQAISRDLLRDALLRVEAHPVYDTVLHAHDEIVAEADEGSGSVEELEALMASPEPWSKDIPVVAEGWRGKRYRK